LIKPFLNDRANSLLTQIDSSHSDAYVKDYLLNEFKLVPSQLLNDYNRLVKQPQQTFKAYMARLRLLLTYFLSGRKVKSLDDMMNLFLCDRLKANIPESMLTHVLRVESALENGAYLAPDDLVTLLYITLHQRLISLVNLNSLHTCIINVRQAIPSLARGVLDLPCNKHPVKAVHQPLQVAITIQVMKRAIGAAVIHTLRKNAAYPRSHILTVNNGSDQTRRLNVSQRRVPYRPKPTDAL